MTNRLLQTERTVYNEEDYFKKFGKNYIQNKISEIIDGMCEDKIVLSFYSRFYKDNDSLKDKKDFFNRKTVKEIKEDFINEVLNAFNDGYVYDLFHSFYQDNRVDIELRYYCDSIEITFWTCKRYSTDTTGTGYSVELYFVDKYHIDSVLTSINKMNLPQSLKQEYIHKINRAVRSREVDIDEAVNYIRDYIKSEINSFVWENEDKFKSYRTLEELNIVSDLKNYLTENEVTNNILDCLSFEFRTKQADILDERSGLCTWEEFEKGFDIEDHNTLNVMFCDEKLNTIHKAEWTEYEIKCL